MMVIILDELEINSLPNDALQIISHVKPEWELTKIAHKIYTEGITNRLIGFWCDNFNDQILVRVYGQKTELFIDRDAEKRNFQILQKHSCGPSLLAAFQNGICYSFIPGEPLEMCDVRKEQIWPKICEQMSLLHKIPIEPNDSSPLTKLGKFIDLIPLEFVEKHKERLQQLGISKEFLISEFGELKTVLPRLNCPVGFAHNDLLLRNIIWNSSKESIHFIDYEYAGLNYLPFDIANHFCEFVGIEGDLNYEKYYPDVDYQRSWIRKYLSYYLSKPLTEVTDNEVEIWRSWVAKFALASHIYWGSWGLLQACYSNIDVDFMQYASLRLQEYKKRKSEFLTQ